MACEKINIDGREITTNGKMNSELVIEIINCRNLLSNQNNMSELGKKVATIFKKSLENRNAYSVYKTIFVTKKEIGGYH